ncbi:MAG: DNRLRE domain-containing protein [Myxococcota bacterium]|nr:DNRLRE domain-containing protein [Myxococcota bacterium]
MAELEVLETSDSHEQRASYLTSPVRLPRHEGTLPAFIMMVALGLLGYALLPQPARAASTTIEIVASADNSLIYSTTDSGAADRVYANGDLAVGCNWIDGVFRNDWVCYSTALKFDLPAAAAGRTIYGATLRLYAHTSAGSFDTQYRIAAFYQNWGPSTITFANQPQYWTASQTFIYPPTLNPVEINVTGIVSNWANGTWNNYGFLLEDTDYIFPGLTLYRATFFHSTNSYGFAVQRPTLIVSYDAPDPPVVSVSADATSIGLGESTTVRWTAAGALSCTFLRVGDPLGSSVPVSGSRTVAPSQTTSYRVVCSNAVGSDYDTVTISVPEPGQALLAVAALATLLGLRRRRRSRP